MATSLTFRNHEEFHRAAIHMAAAGALAGLAAHVAGLAWAGFGPIAGAWGLAVLAGAAALGATLPDERAQVRRWGAILALALAAGVGQALTGGAGARASHGLLFAFITAALFARSLGGRRYLAALATGFAAALVARFIAVRFTTAPELAAIPAWLTAAGAGAAFAFTMVMALLPRHLDLVRDRVAEAHERVRGKASGEMAELTERAFVTWQKVEPTLEPESAERRAIEDAVVRLFEVAGRWQAVEADGARQPADALVERMQQIDEKIARSEDDVARGQYQQARGALAEQLTDLREIATSRERVIARMHHYLAAMERLRFAVIRHKSADASRLSTEVQPILDDLRDLGREIDLTAEAMGEVEQQDAADAEAARPTAQA